MSVMLDSKESLYHFISEIYVNKNVLTFNLSLLKCIFMGPIELLHYSFICHAILKPYNGNELKKYKCITFSAIVCY